MGFYDVKISKTTMVTVSRQVKAFPTQQPSVWGPMSIDKALKSGHMTTSSGTVSVTVTVVEGEHKGCSAFDRGMEWFVQVFPDY